MQNKNTLGILNKNPGDRFNISQILGHSWCRTIPYAGIKSSKPPPLLTYPIVDDHVGLISDDDANSSTAYEPSAPTSPLRPLTLRPIDELRDSLGSDSLRSSSSPLGRDRRATNSTAGTAAQHSGDSSVTSPRPPSTKDDHYQHQEHQSPQSANPTHSPLNGNTAPTGTSNINTQMMTAQKTFNSASHSRAWTGSRGQIIKPTETTLIPFLDVLYSAEIEAELEKSGTVSDLLGIQINGDDKSIASLKSNGHQSVTSNSGNGSVKKWFMGVFKRPSTRGLSITKAASP